MSDDLREQLADVQHGIWAHWMRYQFSVCLPNGLGGALIPSDKADRWRRQMDTAYPDLTDKERESDRHQADKVLAVVQPELDHLRTALTASAARAEAAEAKVVAASDLVYELIEELCDATGRTRADVEAQFLGEVQP